MQELLRIIQLKNKPVCSNLTQTEISFNDQVSYDLIIVLFGRMGSLYEAMSYKWRWDKYHFDMIMRLCIGFKNLHIGIHSLRATDQMFLSEL